MLSLDSVQITDLFKTLGEIQANQLSMSKNLVDLKSDITKKSDKTEARVTALENQISRLNAKFAGAAGAGGVIAVIATELVKKVTA